MRFLLALAAVAMVSTYQLIDIRPTIRVRSTVMRLGESRRPSRVGHLVRSELASVLASGHVRGGKQIPGGLNQMISIVDINMSPDLRNARVKVSIIGERKDKISALRWLQGNSKSIRFEMAKGLKGMRRIPELSFEHVDVGAAVDIMVKLEELAEDRRRVERARGDELEREDLDFSASDEDAFDFDEEDELDLEDEDDASDDGYEDGDVDELFTYVRT